MKFINKGQQRHVQIVEGSIQQIQVWKYVIIEIHPLSEFFVILLELLVVTYCEELNQFSGVREIDQ